MMTVLDLASAVDQAKKIIINCLLECGVVKFSL